MRPGIKSQFSSQLSGDLIPVPNSLWAPLPPSIKHALSLKVFLSMISVGEMGRGTKPWPRQVFLMVASSNVSPCRQWQTPSGPPTARISLGPLPGLAKMLSPEERLWSSLTSFREPVILVHPPKISHNQTANTCFVRAWV